MIFVYGCVFVNLWGFIYLTCFIHFYVLLCWLLWLLNISLFMSLMQPFLFVVQAVLESCTCSTLDLDSAITPGFFQWGMVFRGHSLSVRIAHCYWVKLHLSTFFFSFFFLIYLSIMLLQLSHFLPHSLHSILPTPSLPHSPPIVHVHGSYL